MKVQTAKRMIRLQEWAAQIADCTQSGKTVRAWCREHAINEKTYYHRVKVVREEMLERIESRGGASSGLENPTNREMLVLPEDPGGNGRGPAMQQWGLPVFAALPSPQARYAAITVRKGAYAVDIQNGVDEELVEQVIRVVSRL